jgi:hypothetical protein
MSSKLNISRVKILSEFGQVRQRPAVFGLTRWSQSKAPKPAVAHCSGMCHRFSHARICRHPILSLAHVLLCTASIASALAMSSLCKNFRWIYKLHLRKKKLHVCWITGLRDYKFAGLLDCWFAELITKKKNLLDPSE